MFKTFLQFTSIIIVLCSSIFLVRGALVMSPKDILNLSGTYWNSSPFAAKSYCSQKADSIIGTVLLLISFALQIWVVYLPAHMDDSVNYKGVILAFIVSIISSMVGLVISDCLRNHFYNQVTNSSKEMEHQARFSQP
jgi:hypothetical protein